MESSLVHQYSNMSFLTRFWELKFFQTDQSLIGKNISTLKTWKEPEYSKRYYPSLLYNYCEREYTDFSYSLLKRELDSSVIYSIEYLIKTGIENMKFPETESFIKNQVIRSVYNALKDPYTSLFNLDLYTKLKNEQIAEIQKTISEIGRPPIVFLLSRVGFVNLDHVPEGFIHYNRVVHFFNFLVYDGKLEPYSYISQNTELEEQKAGIAMALYKKNKQSAYTIADTIKRENIKNQFRKVISYARV